MHSTYPMMLDQLRLYAIGNEEKLLNAIWIGLLGLEALMVCCATAMGLARRFAPRSKQKLKTT